MRSKIKKLATCAVLLALFAVPVQLMAEPSEYQLKDLSYVPERDTGFSVRTVNYWPQDVINELPLWVVDKLNATGRYQEFEDHLWYSYHTYGELPLDRMYAGVSRISDAQWNNARSEIEGAINNWDQIIQSVCDYSESSCDQTQRYEAIGSVINVWLGTFKKFNTAQAFEFCRDC